MSKQFKPSWQRHLPQTKRQGVGAGGAATPPPSPKPVGAPGGGSTGSVGMRTSELEPPQPANNRTANKIRKLENLVMLVVPSKF
jgi:hypothetical protein